MSNSRGPRMFLVSALAAVLVAGLLTAVGVLGFASTANATEQLYLEAVEDVGANPFAPATGPKSPVSRSTPADPGGAAGGVNVEAPLCDAAALVASLQGDASLAAAWTEALNSDATLSWSGGNEVRPDQVAAYIEELTAQVLRKDVRVTNFQWLCRMRQVVLYQLLSLDRVAEEPGDWLFGAGMNLTIRLAAGLCSSSHRGTRAV